MVKSVEVENNSSGNMLEKLVPILLLGSIVLAFVVGMLWQKVSSLEKGGGATNNVAANPQAQQPVEEKGASLDEVKSAFDSAVIKFGKSNSKLVMIEVADPSCPYCHVAGGKNPTLNASAGDQFKLVSDGGTYVAPVPEMKKLVDDGKASLAYVYAIGHGNGEMGMKAMYCAFEKGKFWPVHDLLYTKEGYDLLNNSVKNDKSKSQELADFLKGAMNAGDMKNCLDSGKYDEQLTKDLTIAQNIGINGTPGFYVNDTPFRGAYSYKDMESTIQSAL